MNTVWLPHSVCTTSTEDIHSQESSRLPEGQGEDEEPLMIVSIPVSGSPIMLTKGSPVLGEAKYEDHYSPNHAQPRQKDGWSNLPAQICHWWLKEDVCDKKDECDQAVTVRDHQIKIRSHAGDVRVGDILPVHQTNTICERISSELTGMGDQKHLHIRPNAGIKRRSIRRRILLASLGVYWLRPSLPVSASYLEVFEEPEASSTRLW